MDRGDIEHLGNRKNLGWMEGKLGWGRQAGQTLQSLAGWAQ